MALPHPLRYHSLQPPSTGNQQLETHTAIPRRTNIRWLICGLLFLATTINYIDRAVIGILKETLLKDLSWDDGDYGHITLAFQLTYAFGQLGAGYLMDRLGTRAGFSIAIILWSIAGAVTGTMRSLLGFGFARAALGIGEGGNFPGSIRTVAEWFPKSERALATGVFNAGSNVGAILAPIIVPVLTILWGWPAAFYVTGVLGFLWLLAWLPLYRRPEEHKWVNAAELAHIRSDPPDPVEKTPWLPLLGKRQTWAIALARLLSDPIWWFWLFWLPGFLQKTYGIDLKGLALPMVIIYLAADVGSIAGGWLSSGLLKRGWSANAARKTTMLLCAVCTTPVLLVPFIPNVWYAVSVVALAAAAHQGWSANVYTAVSDTFPRKAVASVVGIAGMCGALGGAAFSEFAGQYVKATNHYLWLFLVAGSAYLLALILLHLLAPRLEQTPAPGRISPSEPIYTP